MIGNRIDEQKLNSELIKEVQQIELDCLHELKDICDRNGLKIYLMYGSLLGAVRNGGTITGDDDIDVALLREDYDKLVSLLRTSDYRVADENGNNLFFQIYESDNCFRGGYAKLMDLSTTAIHEQNTFIDCCEGIGIDVFPIDYCFDNFRQERKKCRMVRHYQRLCYASIYGEAGSFKDMGLLKWKAYKYFGKFLGKKRIADGLNKWMSAGDRSRVGIYAHYSTAGNNTVKSYPISDFDNYKQLSFENMAFCVQDKYKKLLLSRYGMGYMMPVAHMDVKEYGFNHAFYDIERPFSEYKKHFASYFSKVPYGRRIVLVGNESICSEFIKRHGSIHKVDYMVPLDEGRDDSFNNTNSTEFEAIESVAIKSLDILKQDDFSKIFVWLCGFDYHKLYNLMQNIGIEDFFFFHYDSRWMRCADSSMVEEAYYIMRD